MTIEQQRCVGGSVEGVLEAGCGVCDAGLRAERAQQHVPCTSNTYGLQHARVVCLAF